MPLAGRLIVAGVAVCLCAAAALGDIVHLDDGGKVEGKVTDLGDRIRVAVAGGTMTLPRSRVVRIERVEPAEAVIDRRRAALAEGDVKGALVLASDAHQAGLTKREGELLELAVTWAPEDPAARSAMRRWRIFDRVPERDEYAERRLRDDFGVERAAIHRTRHFVVVHDVPAPVARRRAEMLEAAWRKFYDLADRLGLDPAPVKARLEVMLFAQHSDWVAAVGLPREKVAGLHGLYLFSTGRVALYDTNTAPLAIEARERADREEAELETLRTKLAEQRKRIDDLEDSLMRMGYSDAEDERRKHAEAWIERARLDVADSELKMDEHERSLDSFKRKTATYFERENLASTTHEACHQLSFATAVCRPGQPRWLVEGLATLFEISSRKSFVIEAANRRRLGDVQAAWGEGAGSPLEHVISDRVFADERVPRPVAYAESWSVAHWLAREHPDAFAVYTRETSPALPGRPGDKARIAAFRMAFGEDLDRLDRAWKSYIRRL